MTKSELRRKAMAKGSKFFNSDAMKFFGDTMANYGLRTTTINTWTRENIRVYELYRKRPVRHGLTESAYFDIDTLDRRHKKQDVER